MTPSEQAAAAIRLTKRAVASDDQHAYELMCAVVRDSGLLDNMATDDGQPIDMAGFERDMMAYAKKVGTYEE